MPKKSTDTTLGRLACARRRAATGFVSCAVAALLVATPAWAAVPRLGAWESASRADPRVSFDVRGPARAYTVRRMSFPLTCKGDRFPHAWATTTYVRTYSDGRFTAYGFGSVIRGRFTARGRAAVTVHSVGSGECKDTRRYVVRHRGRRHAARGGRYLARVGDAAEVGLRVQSFGRMVLVEDMAGTIPSRCADGSQRPLTLAGPESYVLAAPIRPDGRFDIATAAGGTSIKIAGTVTGGSIAAIVSLAVDLPSGVRCTAVAQALVGSLAFPSGSERGESATYPGAPLIINRPQ